jgi:hypothetical protein
MNVNRIAGRPTNIDNMAMLPVTTSVNSMVIPCGFTIQQILGCYKPLHPVRMLGWPGWLAFFGVFRYVCGMEIENVSTTMSQDKIREEAAVKAQGMALRQAEAEAAELAKLMESAEVVTDTEVGGKVDLLG